MTPNERQTLETEGPEKAERRRFSMACSLAVISKDDHELQLAMTED